MNPTTDPSMNPDLAMPEGLCEKGRASYHAILALLIAQGATFTGGCKVFHSPKAWRERGERYGGNSVLVVVHDGGDHAGFFNWDYEQPASIDAVRRVLSPCGTFAEQATSWYSAIYPA